MVHFGSIPLVRARGFGELPDLLAQRAGERALLETFEKEGVSISISDAPCTLMPLWAMQALFCRGARLIGDRLFGLDVGERMTYRGYGMWAEYSALASTLGSALRRAVVTSAAHIWGAHLEFVPEGDRWIWRFVFPSIDVCSIQHADHLLPPMLAFARQYLGSDWRPDWVEVSYARDPAAWQIEERLQTPILFGRAGVGIVLRADDLVRRRSGAPVRPGRLVTLRDVRADMVLQDAPEPAGALSAVVAMRLLDGQSDIDGAARLANMSVQGMQRRLRRSGYTYREIVDEARRARAASLLLDTDLSIVEIALSLGYQEHANFTRAFVRWFGCAPSDMRRARPVVQH